MSGLLRNGPGVTSASAIVVTTEFRIRSVNSSALTSTNARVDYIPVSRIVTAQMLIDIKTIEVINVIAATATRVLSHRALSYV